MLLPVSALCIRMQPVKPPPTGSTVPKERPKVNIGGIIRNLRAERGLSQGDIEKRTGLLRCYLSRVENGHTVPSLETLSKIAKAFDLSLAAFFPQPNSSLEPAEKPLPPDMTEEEMRFLVQIRRYSQHLTDGDKKLLVAMVRKMAAMAHRS